MKLYEAYRNTPLYKTSVNLNKSRLWDKICPKNDGQKFWKNKHKHIAMYPCTKF